MISILATFLTMWIEKVEMSDKIEYAPSDNEAVWILPEGKLI